VRRARPAVFLDRDGTVIEDRHYLADPDGVALLPGAADAIARLNRAGLPVVLVTNQSGIGRGYFTEADFQQVQRRLESLLREAGAHLDAVFHCPHPPDAACPCRKPAPGLFLQAADRLAVDLRASFLIGDRPRDVLPGIDLGASGYLIGGRDAEPAGSLPRILRVPSLGAAVERILGEAGDD
jgi:D-glycero-D-manno-heptose 1,7-bisphosphate phosphatase